MATPKLPDLPYQMVEKITKDLPLDDLLSWRSSNKQFVPVVNDIIEDRHRRLFGDVNKSITLKIKDLQTQQFIDNKLWTPVLKDLYEVKVTYFGMFFDTDYLVDIPNNPNFMWNPDSQMKLKEGLKRTLDVLVKKLPNDAPAFKAQYNDLINSLHIRCNGRPCVFGPNDRVQGANVSNLDASYNNYLALKQNMPHQLDGTLFSHKFLFRALNDPILTESFTYQRGVDIPTMVQMILKRETKVSRYDTPQGTQMIRDHILTQREANNVVALIERRTDPEALVRIKENAIRARLAQQEYERQLERKLNLLELEEESYVDNQDIERRMPLVRASARYLDKQSQA